MTKNTHVAGGVAITVGIMNPTSFSNLAICLAAATVGSVISDIDVSTSKSRRELNRVLIISIIAIFLCTMAECIFHLGILSMIQTQSNITRILLGFMMFLLICCFGITTPHRSFMHSLVGVISLTGATFIMFPQAVLPFAISMMSHIFLDFFNTKKVQFLYPLEKPRIGFKLCKASGKANKLIFFVATFFVVIEMIVFIIFQLKRFW